MRVFVITAFVSISVLVLLGVSLTSIGKFNKIAGACGSDGLSDGITLNEKYGYFEGVKTEVPLVADTEGVNPVLGVNNEEKWVEVDLSDQKLRAWEGSSIFLETLVSTGLPWWPTPQGEFRVWAKIRATKMEGGEGKNYYNLPNVPFVMFFENTEVPGRRGFGLHGTYWHNDFGRVRSHGCVNLPTNIAEQLYYWTTPTLPEGKRFVRSSADNPGTRVVIHE